VTNARLDDKRMRDLYDQILVTREDPGRTRCSSPEALLALVRRDGPEEERLSTLDHAMSCADCARELELLRAIEDAGARGDASERAGATSITAPAEGSERVGRVLPLRTRSPWRRYAPLALAASVLVAVGVTLVQRDGRPGGDDLTRGSSAVTLLAPPNDARPSAGTLSFAWHAVPGTVRYALEVLDSAGVVRFSATTPDTTVALTDLGALTPGVEYRWWVQAIDAAGAQRASAMRPLRVRTE